MIRFLLYIYVRTMLWLRYRIRTRGFREVARRGTSGIVFLPNHPALIDPIIMLATLWTPFRPMALADKDQVDRFFIRYLARKANVKPIPDIAAYGKEVSGEVQQAIDECIEHVRHDGNLLLYPSGHLYRSRFEDLRGNSGLKQLLDRVPDARVVLVRTRGLWGSRFSYAQSGQPDVQAVVWQSIKDLAKNLFFFMPRREVTVTFAEPEDLPRDADRETLNRYLEAFYNEDAERNTHVPYSRWSDDRVRTMPEPPDPQKPADASEVPEEVRRKVIDHLRQETGLEEITDEQHLARDLGLDSLARIDLIGWIEGQFGAADADTEALATVADVMVVADGQSLTRGETVKAPPPAWFDDVDESVASLEVPGRSVPEAFLAQARRFPRRVIVADQLAGARTYREMVLACLALTPKIEAIEGERLGLLMPASVVADILWLSTLFAGKTPVMVNWTVGHRYLKSSLAGIDCRRVVTSKTLVERLARQGVDLSSIEERLVFVEDLRAGVGRFDKLIAFVRSRFSWRRLRKHPVPETAGVLFTSGSETAPKAVPLTQTNVIEDIDAAKDYIPAVSKNTRLLAMLPPFHSFGLTGNMAVPLVLGLPAVYYPNPTEAPMLVRIIQAYRPNFLIATPTFLAGILKQGSAESLASLELVITGAETCPESVYDRFDRLCPNGTITEGYGITETGPIAAVNPSRNPKRGTVGKVIPGMEHVVVNPDTIQPVDRGRRGMLLLRGPSVFPGYLNYDGRSPWVEYAGKTWYRTGDLVVEDDDGYLTFKGRLKRFVKLGGEMISLPAIEEVLRQAYGSEADEGPVLAVVAAGEEKPELVLFTTRDIDRGQANDTIREAGLSGLHTVRRVERIDEMPLLGTGKVDYRTLQGML